jgi:hypothetical protein
LPLTVDYYELPFANAKVKAYVLKQAKIPTVAHGFWVWHRLAIGLAEGPFQVSSAFLWEIVTASITIGITRVIAFHEQAHRVIRSSAGCARSSAFLAAEP